MRKLIPGAILAAGVAVVVSSAASAGSGGPTFSNQVLRAPAVLPGITTSPPGQSGDSEPAIDFGGPDNTMAVDGLGWLPFAVNLWKGHFGDTPPQFFGAMDTSLPIQGNGRVNLGDGDADVEVTSVGTILLADLDIIFNRTGRFTSLGVSVTRCPATAASKADCTSTVLDTSGADRPWLTTSGTTAYVSWHNAGNSSQITVYRSTNDGQTWTRVASPILGQGKVTGNSTFNNSIGPLVADPLKPNVVYQPFASGEASVQKGTSGAFNNIYVARSTNGGDTWTTSLVFHEPLFTDLANRDGRRSQRRCLRRVHGQEHRLALLLEQPRSGLDDHRTPGHAGNDGHALGRSPEREGGRRLLRHHPRCCERGRSPRCCEHRLEYLRHATQRWYLEHRPRQHHAEPGRTRMPERFGLRGQHQS
jgi:hypothetical protein